ncbi:MAG: DUF4157 domain-containing protein [Novosphingobium sp.]
MASAAVEQRKQARDDPSRARDPPRHAASSPASARRISADPGRSALLATTPVEPGGSVARRVQASLKISQPGDAAEREAESTARAVMAMRQPTVEPSQRVALLAARDPSGPTPMPDRTTPELGQAIKSELGGGRALPDETHRFMQKRFGADFSGVRVHTDGRAQNLATRLGANAFTYGRDIFFNAGQFQPDNEAGMELIAHELTHTIQQREVVQREIQVSQKTGPQVQRGLISRALDWLADKANYIPGFRMFTIVIGVNPINMSRVDRSGANILRAMIEFIPGGGLIVDAFNNHGLFEKGGKFIEDQFAALGMVGSAFRDALMDFLDSLGWSDLFHPGDVWDRAKRIFTAPVDRLISFAKGLVSGIAELIKDAIIKPLGRWAAGNIPKWNLLVAVFGKNPISDENESPASAIIGEFMALIGQQEIWENIKKGNAVARAWQWFQAAMKGALSLVTSIPGRVMGVIRSLTIIDIVTIAGAFKKIVTAFSSFVGDFIGWAGGTVLNLLEIIFSVVAPAVLPYLKKAGSAFSTIIKAPARFIATLVKAGQQGFNQFKTNIVRHLRDALFKWLLGSAEGASVYFPKSFAPLELLKMGLSVLGLTWANIRGKLVTATNETVVKALETGFDLVVTLVRDGPAAAWQQLMETLSNLKSMVVDAAIDFVKGEVVKIAIEKLVSFLTPAGAFVQAVIAIYRTISFIVAKLAEIGRLVAAFIDGIAALAAGIVAAAANKVETVLVSGMSLAISFLANFAGLGNIPKKVMAIIKKIRDPVDKALNKVVEWIIAQARRVGKAVAQAGVPHDPNERLRLAAQASLAIASRLPRTGVTAPVIARAHDAIKLRYALTELTPYQHGGAWYVRAVINPPLVWRLPLPGETSGAGGVTRVASVQDPATGVLSAGVEGRLLPGQTRATAPNFNDAMPRIATLPPTVAHFVSGFEWAHLYGPGFGDEAATGLMMASPQVNRQLQSLGRVRGIEGRLRELGDVARAAGGNVRVRVTGESFPDPPPGVPAPLNVPVLRRVVYFVTIIAPDGRTDTGRGYLDVGPLRPNGTGGLGTFDIGTL